MSDTTNKPDHHFIAVLRAGESWSTELPCKLFLPRSPSDGAKLVLKPTREQFYTIRRLRTCSLVGRVGDDKNYTSFEVKKLRVAKGQHTLWGSNLSEFVLEMNAWDLTISHVSGRSKSNDKETYFASFQLTPSHILKPFDIRTFCLSGDVKIEYPPEHQLSVELEPDFLVTFKHHYSSRTDKNGAIVREPRLVAVSEFPGSPADFDCSKALLLLDDFLLLASFAERQRCVLRGWVLEDSMRVVVFHRLDRLVPSLNPDRGTHEYLIDGLYAKQFLQEAQIVLRNHPFRDLLRHALQAITCESSTVGENFLRFFSALETALLAFRRQDKLEYVLNSSEERKAFLSDLKKFIRGHKMFHGDKKETKEKRSFLYENLPALNRVSLGAALGRFFERYQIIHDHLWPVVSDGPQWSLAKIRNKIAHGEPFTESEWGDVALAAEHIRWISERMVLSLLEWPLEKSRVNCFYAEEMARLNDWAAARERLSGL